MLNSQPFIHVLSQINPFHALLLYFFESILILSSKIRTGFASVFFLASCPPENLFAYTVSLVLATYPAHLIHLDLITRITFSEEHRLRSFSLCNFLHTLIFLALRHRALSQHPVLENFEPTFSCQYETIGKVMVLCILIFMFR